MKVPVKILLTSAEARVPEYSKSGDAGADVYAVSSENKFSRKRLSWSYLDCSGKIADLEDGDYLIESGGTVLVGLGFSIELPPQWEMQVRSRSGLAKRGITVPNSPGTIDSGYRGPCGVLLHNNNNHAVIIKPGDRIAQFVLKAAPQANYQQVDKLGDSERGEGGFGSTGCT